jgi:hypothetical protein
VLDKTIKLEWHKAANARTRCLRITQKEEKAVRGRLQSKCAGVGERGGLLGICLRVAPPRRPAPFPPNPSLANHSTPPPPPKVQAA